MSGYIILLEGCNNESKICMVTNPKGKLLDESRFFAEGAIVHVTIMTIIAL